MGLLTGLLLVVASAAEAEEGLTASAPVAGPEVFQARVRYGVSVRSGAQRNAVDPDLSYRGLTPNDLGLNAWGWFALNGHLGVFGSLHREAFALFDGGEKVAGGGLIRFAAGPTGRVFLGPLKLEAAVGYAFHQLPMFGNVSQAPAFKTALRHGVLLAARGIVDVGPVSIEARGEVPIAVSVADDRGQPAGSFGYAVGGGVRLQLLRLGNLRWGLLADVTYVSDSLTAAGGLTATQEIIRAGGALDVKWQEDVAAEAARFGELQVQVFDADTGQAVADAAVEVAGQQLRTDAGGAVKVSGLVPGSIAARATAEGYEADAAQGTVVGGGVASLTLTLKREAARPGKVVVTVVSRELKTPVAKATVTLGDRTAMTDENGVAAFDEVAAGVAAVAVTAEGFNAGEEAVSVVAGQRAEVTVALVEVKKRVAATITGLVRSTVGGKPVAANLEIPQAKIKTRASAAGAFSLRVEGGTYTITISAPGYLPQTKRVTVKDGDQAIFNVDLFPK